MRTLTTVVFFAAALSLGGQARAQHQPTVASMVKWGARTNGAVAKIQRLAIQVGGRQLVLENRGVRSRPVEVLRGTRGRQPTRLVLDGIQLRVEARSRGSWKRVDRVEGALTAPDLTSASYNLLARSFGSRLRARHIKPLGKVLREMTPK